jgi:hypothetical protein
MSEKIYILKDVLLKAEDVTDEDSGAAKILDICVDEQADKDYAEERKLQREGNFPAYLTVSIT